MHLKFGISIFGATGRRLSILIVGTLVGCLGAAGQSRVVRRTQPLLNVQLLSGHFYLSSEQRFQSSRFSNGEREQPNTAAISARIAVRSQAFMIRPGLVTLNLNGEFRPGYRRDTFLRVPDRKQANTAESLRIRASLFSSSLINLSLFSSIGHQYSYRDFISSVNSKRFQTGQNFSVRDRRFPLQIRHVRETWKETELNTDRIFENRSRLIKADLRYQSPRSRLNKFGIIYDDLTRDYPESIRIQNRILTLSAENRFFSISRLDRSLSSTISYVKQTGTSSRERFDSHSSISAALPGSFRFIGNHGYTRDNISDVRSRQNQVTVGLTHALYESLDSRIEYESTSTAESSRRDSRTAVRGSVRYRKKIPAQGHLTLSFNGERRQERRDDSEATRRVIDEAKRLIDTDLVLLDQPFVLVESVRVGDDTRTVIYDEGIDYLLIPRQNFVEIKRVPGGQINNGATVFVDYAVRSTVFSALVHSTGFGADLSFFQNKVDFYFRSTVLDFTDVAASDSTILKTIDRQLFGLRVIYRLLSAGIERDLFGSNIVPYESIRYYLTFSSRFSERIDLTLAGSLRDLKLTETGEHQTYRNLNGQLRFAVKERSSVLLTGRLGRDRRIGSDLDLAAVGAEFKTSYRALTVSLGVDLYNRNFEGERINYTNWRFRVGRTF